MVSWLRLLLMLFHAPLRGMREVRDRAALAPAALLALVASASFFFYLTWLYPSPLFSASWPVAIIALVSQAAGSLVFIALVLSPLAIFFANFFERRASFRLVLQQEYSALTSTIFYAFTAANLVSILITAVGRFSGITQALSRNMLADLQQRAQLSSEAGVQLDERLVNTQTLSLMLMVMILLLVFMALTVVAIQIVLRLTIFRSLVVVVLSSTLLLPASVFLVPIFSMILGSPFLLIMLFLVLRGYFSDMARSQRARESFRQNLEAATLNPADASAHYNLGLIHQQRGELDAARERFERAVQIDDDEIDAHYQLGRIARQQKRFAEAIRNFEQVVSRAPAHSQYEVWREVGATYLAANQYQDARTALESFLENRPSDPEGLYLMGRAHAGLGDNREAASLMEKCIEAVKTAPAYKYRASKRWLNEAQQFLRSQV